MKLRNAFPLKVRLLYLGHWRCFLCGSNGSTNGGLEIHHILGRISDSAFNSSCLCRKCHAGICHNWQEHQDIFYETFAYLRAVAYQPTDEDYDFLRENFKELVGERLKNLLQLPK